jgi:hypothetical protein
MMSFKICTPHKNHENGTRSTYGMNEKFAQNVAGKLKGSLESPLRRLESDGLCQNGSLRKQG